jgi:folylpolyglutamate synthase
MYLLKWLRSSSVCISSHQFQVELTLALGLSGAHQRQNATLAMHLAHRFLQLQSPTTKLPSSLSPIPGLYSTALSEARWAGRCQQVADPSRKGLQWFLDGAHTVESLICCAEWYFTPELALRYAVPVTPYHQVKPNLSVGIPN